MKTIFSAFVLVMILAGCNNSAKKTETTDTVTNSADTMPGHGQAVNLPEPYATKSVQNMSKVIGWPAGKMPMAPAGFTVSVFADSLDSPRWIYVADNGDVFVSQAKKDNSPNNVLLFRDSNNDGKPDLKSVFLSGLNMPFGMLKHHDHFYVANTDALIQYDYPANATSITTAGRKIIALPGGPRHWTRNIISNADGSKIYIAVGSSSNVAEKGLDKEIRRANILEINPDGTGEVVYASGLRNPVGMDWQPGTNTLWTVVNERDELGDDLVPDYLTSVKRDAFYGWPFSYFGQHMDPRLKDSARANEMMQKAIIPDYQLNSHTASLGLVFYKGNKLGDKYNNGAFIGQHGSWNRSVFAGYKVVFVPFSNGRPGTMEDFLTGFIADESKNEVYGRPVGVAVAKDGSLLVADDGGNKIWRISKQ